MINKIGTDAQHVLSLMEINVFISNQSYGDKMEQLPSKAYRNKVLLLINFFCFQFNIMHRNDNNGIRSHLSIKFSGQSWKNPLIEIRKSENT